jgi:uncharacterized membrane protein YtjA (UPF0391 family)
VLLLFVPVVSENAAQRLVPARIDPLRVPVHRLELPSWAVTFLVIALIAGLLGFTGIAGAATGIAKIMFLVFLLFSVVSLVAGRRGSASL